MRILIIPSWYPTPSNPVNGIFVRQQAEALGKAHDVRVLYLDVMPRGQRRRPKRYRNKTPGYTEEIIEVPNRLFLWQFTYLWYMLRSLLKLKREFKPDVIHSHVAVPAGWAVALLHPFLGVPIVLTEHTAEFDSWLKRPGQRCMAALAYGRADVVMPVSEGQRIRLQQSFRCRHRVEVVPNMVDTNRFTQTPFPPTQDGYRLLFVGLMETGQKGVPFLLEAISQIIEARQLRLHLDLVGGGKLLPEYKALAARQALNDFVTFHGIQPHAFIASLLAQTHALVLPSLQEALPVAIIEALVSGRPVISTRCGGPEALINTSNGLLVEPRNASELAVAIKKLLADIYSFDPNLIASEARKLFSHEAVATALTKVYEDVLLNIPPD